MNKLKFMECYRAVLRQKFNILVNLILEQCLNVYGQDLVTLAVFGSVGRGTPNPFSDIDLLIVARNLPCGRMPRMAQFSKIEAAIADVLNSLRNDGIETSLSPVIKAPKEVEQGSLLFLDMIDDARLIFDREDFFFNYLAKLKARLEQLGAVKIKQGQRWYWHLKPDYSKGEVFEI
jgi:predicted nucleotidyltransferase